MGTFTRRTTEAKVKVFFVFGLRPQTKLPIEWSGSPGIVVMGGNSCPSGCMFESYCGIQDGSSFDIYLL